MRALIYGFLAAFLLGTHAVIVRYLTADMAGAVIATLRLYIACLCLGLFIRLKGHKLEWPKMTKIHLLTVVGFCVNFIFFHIGLGYTTATNAMLIENSAPVFLLIILFFVKHEEIRLIEVVAILVAVAGVFVTVRHDIDLAGYELLGDLDELIAAVAWAVFILGSSTLTRACSTPIERLAILFQVMLIGSIVLTPFLFFYAFGMSWFDLLLLVGMGVFSTAMAYALWYQAIAEISPLSASLYFALTVVFTLLNENIFLNEPLTLDMGLGAAMIVVAVLLTTLKSDKA